VVEHEVLVGWIGRTLLVLCTPSLISFDLSLLFIMTVSNQQSYHHPFSLLSSLVESRSG